MKSDTQALIDELNRIRLDDDRSYADLAAGIGIDPGALYKILNDQTSAPYDRTIAKIQRFLERHPKPTKRPPKRRREAA